MVKTKNTYYYIKMHGTWNQQWFVHGTGRLVKSEYQGDVRESEPVIWMSVAFKYLRENIKD